MDPAAVLVENLKEALQNVNTYVAVGSATAVSAFVLDRQESGSAPSEPVTIPGGFVAMVPGTAKLVLLGLYFVAGLLAYSSAVGAERIARMLQANRQLFEAVCTYPSIATASIGIRLGAVVLPIAFVLPIILRTWKRIRIVAPDENVSGLIMLIGFSALPYAALGIVLMRFTCAA